jgi:hypothetical protein
MKAKRKLMGRRESDHEAKRTGRSNATAKQPISARKKRKSRTIKSKAEEEHTQCEGVVHASGKQ